MANILSGNTSTKSPSPQRKQKIQKLNSDVSHLYNRNESIDKSFDSMNDQREISE